MTKSNALKGIASLARQISEGVDDGEQFKIVCRILARQDRILTECGSLVNLFEAIEDEIRAAQLESIPF